MDGEVVGEGVMGGGAWACQCTLMSDFVLHG